MVLSFGRQTLLTTTVEPAEADVVEGAAEEEEEVAGAGPGAGPYNCGLARARGRRAKARAALNIVASVES